MLPVFVLIDFGCFVKLFRLFSLPFYIYYLILSIHDSFFVNLCLPFCHFRLSQHIQLSIIDFVIDVGHLGSLNVSDATT